MASANDFKPTSSGEQESVDTSLVPAPFAPIKVEPNPLAPFLQDLPSTNPASSAFASTSRFGAASDSASTIASDATSDVPEVDAPPRAVSKAAKLKFMRKYGCHFCHYVNKFKKYVRK